MRSMCTNIHPSHVSMCISFALLPSTGMCSFIVRGFITKALCRYVSQQSLSDSEIYMVWCLGMVEGYYCHPVHISGGSVVEKMKWSKEGPVSWTITPANASRTLHGVCSPIKWDGSEPIIQAHVRWVTNLFLSIFQHASMSWTSN